MIVTTILAHRHYSDGRVTFTLEVMVFFEKVFKSEKFTSQIHVRTIILKYRNDTCAPEMHPIIKES